MKINKMIRKRKGASGGMRTRKTRACLEAWKFVEKIKKKHDNTEFRALSVYLGISASRLSSLPSSFPERERQKFL